MPSAGGRSPILFVGTTQDALGDYISRFCESFLSPLPVGAEPLPDRLPPATAVEEPLQVCLFDTETAVSGFERKYTAALRY